MDIEKIKSKAQELAKETTELRRHLHAHPELSWEEVETTRLIVSKLEAIGFKNIKVGVDGKQVGVVADLVGDPQGPCVALRADIDALSMEEKNTVEYKSRNKEAMHACGHDAHTSVLLGAAKLLSSMKDEIPGKIRFIFQPAEEHGLHSGAQIMIKEGVLEGVQAIAGMHIWSFVPSGKVQWRVGPVMASVDAWEAKFIGKGGHGGMPHKSIDPTLAAANFILSLQTVVSREIDPLETSVVSVGKMLSGEAMNVIPDTATVVGNTRNFNEEVQGKMAERIRRIAEGCAATYGCKAETSYTQLYPKPVINDKTLTHLFRETAVKIAGEENVEETPPLMGAEDYSFYLSKIPGVLFFLGCGDEKKETAFPHHSPRFNVDDDVLPSGISLMSAFALAMLEKLNKDASR